MTEIEIYKQIVQRQGKYIEHLKMCADYGWKILPDKFEPELASLRQQLEKAQEDNSNEDEFGDIQLGGDISFIP